MRGVKTGSFICICILFVIIASTASAITPKTNVLILFSNDWTATLPGHSTAVTYDNTVDYYGYFDPNKYYEYQANKSFAAVGYSQNHYAPEGNYWSGNFLNWATMTHADLIRKTLTGGKRSIDANTKTVLQRADVISQSSFNKNYSGEDLNRLVPAIYANPNASFYSIGTNLKVIDELGRELSPSFNVSVEVCDVSMPEGNCLYYKSTGMKPEGLVQRYYKHMNFGLMSHTTAQSTEGGVLRVPIGPVEHEFSANSGQLSSGEGVINIINNLDSDRGWNPTAEKYYEALRYLKGNESGQEVYCGPTGMSAEEGFNVYGCASNRLWVDPISDPCQKTVILIVSDEYPSKDSNLLPGSAFYPGYYDTPMNFGTNTPYNPDVSALTNVVGDVEGISGSRQIVGNVIGSETGTCSQKQVFNLSEVNGICPSEPQAEGSFYLAGLAHDAFIGDLRPDLIGRQNVETYALVYKASPSFYKTPEPPMSPLWLAAKYGNFRDKNFNTIPNSDDEWMKNSELCTFSPDSIGCLPLGFSYVAQGDDIVLAMSPVFLRDIGEDGICDNVGDSDNDGIVDQDDFCPFDPLNDNDSDGICGGIDNCPSIANPGQEDLDGDGIGDACQPPTT